MNVKGYATAHYTSHCQKCDSVIRAGQRIKWTAAKGGGAVHADCHALTRKERIERRRRDAQVPAYAY